MALVKPTFRVFGNPIGPFSLENPKNWLLYPVFINIYQGQMTK